MKDAGFGEPIVGQPLNPGPRKAILLAASPKRPPPEARDVGSAPSADAPPSKTLTATFALNAALCFFRVCFMSCSRAIGAF
jgi:hypothetical protein